jgi:hypothetical protein
MSKNKAKNGIVVNAGNGNYIPNIVRGGTAIPIGKKNFYYMQGKKHEQGGIDIGKNAKTGLEVEGEEVMQVTPKEVRVYSSVPFLRGVSPADLVLNGADADKVFAAQENYKDCNRINDDGSKYEFGGRKRKYISEDSSIIKQDNAYTEKPIIIEPIERTISSADKINVPIGTKYSKLTGKQKLQLFNSDKLNKDREGLKNVSPEFDILTGVRGLMNLPKNFFNNTATKNISTNYYRQGNKGLIDDAKETGIVSVKSHKTPTDDKKISILRKTFDVPFWSKGIKWYNANSSNGKDLIVSIGDNGLNWQPITKSGRFTDNLTISASRRTPLFNGSINNTPSNLFQYYRRYPLIGYRNITNGNPNIPIVGLNTSYNAVNNKYKYGGKNMRKIISINGNVKNGLLHTPSANAFQYGGKRKARFNGRYSKPGLHNLSLLASALILPKGTVNIEEDKPVRYSKLEAHNRLVTADTSQKPLYEKNDNTTVAHVTSERERRTRKFVCGGRSKAKVGKGFRINNDKYNIGDTITYKDKQYIVTDRNEAKPIDKNVNSYVDGIIGAARRVPTSPQLTRNITNGLVNNAPTYKKNGETHYFVEAPKVNYDSGTNLADLQNLLNLIPRKGTNQSNSSSTGGVNNRTAKPTKSTVQRINKLAPATNTEMAGLERGLTSMLRNNFANRLTKPTVNDYNVMPLQDNVAKTRNTDNILLGINLGSSVLDAVMGNIYANQMHGYNAPEIIAPTISNPGEIKINEEDLKDIPAPILMAAAKLKTRYNANPQLSKIEDETRRIMGEIDRNTSNSRVALARKQRVALQGQQAKNEVYGRKENIETELINKDKLNQQEVTARNLARYDQYNQVLAAQRANRARLRLAADTANIQNKLAVNTANANLKSQADRFNATNRINQLIHQAGIDAAKAEARSSIFSSMLGNIGSALNTWNRNKRQAKLDEETLRVLGLRAPNANKLVLSALGY